jgi:hypothetical protein
MKLRFTHFYKPTPKKWRKIGDALLGVSTLVTGGGLLAFDQLTSVFTPKELKAIIGGAFIIGIVGKFITNMVEPKDPEVVPTPQENPPA